MSRRDAIGLRLDPSGGTFCRLGGMLRRFVFLLSCCAVTGCAKSPGATPPTAGIVEAPKVPTAAEAAYVDVRLLESVGGSPLSPAEKQQVFDDDAAGIQTRPKDYTQGYADVRKSLPSLEESKYDADKNNIYTKLNSRESWRSRFAAQASTNVDRQILERHDPTIASSINASKVVTEVVTESSLRSLLQAARWANAAVGLPPPSPDFIAEERRAIEANWSTFTPELRTAYAHIGRNFGMAYTWMMPMSAADRDRIHDALLAKTPVRSGPGASVALMLQGEYKAGKEKPIPSVAEAGDADIQLLEIAGESPLSPTEKQQVLEAAAAGVQSNPKSWAQGYASAQNTLQWFDGTKFYAAGKNNMYPQMLNREYWRVQFASPAQPAVYRQILERHDPSLATTVSPQDSKLVTGIVSESSLRTLLQAVTWANAAAGAPPPPSNFIKEERRELEANWSSFSPELRTAYADIKRNYAAAYMYMLFLNAGQKKFIRASLLTKAPEGAGSGAATALMVKQAYDYLVKNGHHMGVSDQEEIMYMHLMNQQLYDIHRDTMKTMLGEQPY